MVAPQVDGKFRKILALTSVGVIVSGLVWFFLRIRDDDSSQEDLPVPVAGDVKNEPKDSAVAHPTATYAGTATCVTCHQEQAKLYRGSHHDRAIEVPSDATVLAPFAGETFRHDGVTSTFLRKEKGTDPVFVVRTAGIEGKVEDFIVAYTFGVFPLQQYLLDVGGGRLQALSVAWDARPQEAGGQRYFDLYPDEDLDSDDEIHWTRAAQNWNFACADCHTTDLHKGYDATKDTFDPSWAELNVGCEACHGPGSNHVAWSKAASKSALGANVSAGEMGLVVALSRAKWTLPAGARNVPPRQPDENVRELETCAPCHSRRQQLREGRTPDQPFLDAYMPELLSEGLYFADGQMRDEVYVYGSFLQSRMFHAGVRCNDCHDPHSLSLRREGNALCSGCHNAQIYDTPSHHHHASLKGEPAHRQAGDGTACVNCHMPDTTYMQVDPRRDHSFSIPRPDLSAGIGAPDVCTNCHKDKSAEWAADRVVEWFGSEKRHHFAQTFQAARNRDPSAEASLIQLAAALNQPAIVRGTALSLLADFPSEDTLNALHAGAQKSDALVRLGATRGVLGLAPEQRFQVMLPLLSDPLLAIRIEATRALVGVSLTALTAPQRAQLNQAFDELEKTEHFYDDRPDAWLRMALLESGRGKLEASAKALETSLKLDPRFTPALVNLADLRRLQGNETEATNLLHRAVEIEDKNAEAWFALGLSMVRGQKLADALPMLKRASELRPNHPRFAYVYAVALADTGDLRGAVSALQLGLKQSAYDRTLLQALANYAQRAGDRQLVNETAARIEELNGFTGRE